MNLLMKKLQDYAQSSQQVFVRLVDKRIIEGTITSLDDQYVCISDGNGQEIIDLNSISSIRADSVRPVLESAKKNNQTVKVTLSNGSTLIGQVDDIDTSMVSMKLDNGEELIQIKELIKAELMDLSPQPSELVPSYDFKPSTSQKDLLPNIASAAEIVRRSLAMLSWPKNEFVDIDRTCPVSVRVDSRAQHLWGRAMNYHNGKSWAKAAEAFKSFANLYPQYSAGYYNAAVCWSFSGNMSEAITYYELALQCQESKEFYGNGILACVRIGFWHLSTEWMKKYLLFSSGGDNAAFKVIEFQLKYGLYNDAANTVLDCCKLAYSIEPLVGLKYVAFLTVNVASISSQLLNEIEYGLMTSQFSLEQLAQIAEMTGRNTVNQPTPDYLAAQHAEDSWREALQRERAKEKIASLHMQLIGHLNTPGREKQAQEVCLAILELDPEDTKARERIATLQRATRSLIVKPVTEPKEKAEQRNLYQRAKRLMDAGNLSEAEALFQRCVTFGINLENSVKNLASIFLRKGEIQNGVEILNKYLTQATDKEPYYNLLGQLHFKAAQYEEAIKAYQAVRDMQGVDQSKRINPLMSMAAIYVRMGRLNRAEEVLAKVLKIKPNHQQAKNFLERIQSQNLQPSGMEIITSQTDIETFLSQLSRPVGTATVRISQFMRLEVDECTISGLDRYRVEKKQLTLKDVDYLMDKGKDTKVTRPEQRATFFISGAKVLSELSDEQNDKFNQSLRLFCAAMGDHYVIINRDVARAYYMETFKLEPKITPQLHTKFGQLIMTFLYTDNEVFLQPDPPDLTFRLLGKALSPDRSLQMIIDVTRAVIALTRVNPDLLQVLTFSYAQEERDLKDKLGQALIKCFGDEDNNLPTNSISKVLALITKIKQNCFCKKEEVKPRNSQRKVK